MSTAKARFRPISPVWCRLPGAPWRLPLLHATVASGPGDTTSKAILATAFAFWPTPTGSISHWDLEKKLKAEKYTEVGLALGIVNLVGRGYLLERVVTEDDANFGSYDVKHYQVTPDGIAWIQSHKQLLTLKTATVDSAKGFNDFEDDIPF